MRCCARLYIATGDGWVSYSRADCQNPIVLRNIKNSSTIRDVYRWSNSGNPGSKGYILDPHSAVSVTVALRSDETAPCIHCVALSTAHPAKFSHAVEMALARGKRISIQRDFAPAISWARQSSETNNTCTKKSGGLDSIRKIITDEVEGELSRKSS